MKMNNVAFYDILYLWLYYRLVDCELSRNFLVDPSQRQVSHPFTTELQTITLAGVIPTPFDIAAKWQNSLTSEMSRYRCYTNSLWYCSEVTKQSDRWNVTLPVLYQLLLMLQPSVYKPEHHILKTVRQIWAMESTETSRGKKKLIGDGFMFPFHAFSADSTKKSWRCVIRSCRWRLHTDVNDVVVNRLGHYTHGSDAAGVEVAKIKDNMKGGALDTMELQTQIHNQSRQIYWSVRSRKKAKHISNQKVDSRCTGSEWRIPANTCRSRIPRCTRPVQIPSSFTRRRRTIPNRR